MPEIRDNRLEFILFFPNTMCLSYLNYTWLCIFIIGFSGISCSQPSEKKEVASSLMKNMDQTIPGGFSEKTDLVFDSTQIAYFFKKYPDVIGYEQDVRRFYRNRNFSYAWFNKGVLIEQAGNLANRLMNLKNDGVFKQLSYLNTLDSLLYGNNAESLGKPDILLELMLTAEYFVFSKLAWEGMTPAVSKSNKWYLPRKKIAYDQYLDSLLTTSTKELPADEPVYRQYELLKTYLRKYRVLEARDPWLPIASTAKPLKPGDSSLTVLQIKKRLFKLEDYQGDTTSQLFHSDLSLAIQDFQERYGLLKNGLPNKATLAELNIPIKSRIKQILVNMERSRWLPVTLNSDYVAVNIPEFKMHVYHADSLLWSCNAVVGQTTHATTLFYGEIKYVVFSPYWNIPPGILRKEIIPGMKKNPGYLEDHNMEITGYKAGLPVVRQKPGPKNALGLVKFLFPNTYNIYLHDTPAKSLFEASARAFSHGCIRIEEPAKLAGFLLKNNQGWTPDKIDGAMHAGKERYVTIKNKVPVFIAYFTAFIDRNGRLNFRKDIYNLDGRLAATILSGEGVYE